MNIRNLLAAVALLTVSITGLRAATVDEIIDKHLAAIGGKDNWKKVNSLSMEGAITAGGNEIGIKISAIRNKAVRQDITVAGMTGYNIITTTDGWVYMPFQGQQKPEALTPDDVKEQQDGLDIQG
ncbi:MAG TPA: hypothetical protein VHL77_00090, partial [Ferruginibacter sp.]|nr:hypothetical protein [Ferruginibacter sp.]